MLFMRRSLLTIALIGLGSAASGQTIPSVPDSTRDVIYLVSSSTSNFDVPFAVYGDCTDLTVKVNGVTLTGGYTCVSRGGLPLLTIPLPVTDMQVQLATPVTSSTVEITGAFHPRWSMGTGGAVSRTEYNRGLGTILSALRELYDRLGTVAVAAHTVAGLPTCTVSIAGQQAQVVDAAPSPLYNAVPTGGGSLRVPVICNGIEWTYH